MKTQKISARKKLGNNWLHVLQSHDTDRIEILRLSEKDGTLIPFDYMLTEVEYPGASNRFSKGEKIALIPGNSEYQPVISVTNNSLITAHAFTGTEVNQVLKMAAVEQNKMEASIPVSTPSSKPIVQFIPATHKKSIAVSIIQYAGMAAMLTGALFIFTALK